jgi:hypothetical protein
LLLESRGSATGEVPAMIGNAQLQPATDDPIQLAQENGFLRLLVAELLIKNQNLRWALQTSGGYDPRVLATPEGTPLCRN